MDFDLSAEQRAFRDTARDFSDREFAPHAARWDTEQVFPRDAIEKAGALGFCALYAPGEVGGLGLPRLDSSIVLEELARGCTSTTAYITIHNMALWDDRRVRRGGPRGMPSVRASCPASGSRRIV